MPKNQITRIIDQRRSTGTVVYGGAGGGGTSDHGLLTGLGDDDHPLYHNDARGDLRYVPLSRQVLGGAGLTGGGALTGDLTLAVGAGLGITVNANDVALASTVAGSGLTYASGVLNVAVANTFNTSGAGAGLSVEADTVRLTASSNPGSAASLLATESTGLLTLAKLTVNDEVKSLGVSAGYSFADRTLGEGSRWVLYANSGVANLWAGGVNVFGFTGAGVLSTPGNLTLQPAGDLILDPVGNDVLPSANYDVNLGALSKKYLTLHAAELWVETLVAQGTMATIGGRILVGPTTTLTADLSAGATSISTKHNNLAVGDRVYMEADGSVEFMAVTAGPTGTGPYGYTVTRNLDGSGANQWYAGDAIFNTGQAGNGFIDLYSVRGVKTSSQAGPTIVGNVRNSSTYNDWSERWAIGNLNGLFGYGVTTYGLAAGSPSGTWIAAEATNGFRIMRGSTARAQLDTAGNLRLYNASGTNTIALDNDGTSYFAGFMTLGASGGIYQGNGTPSSPATGLKVWRDGSGIGRIAGYNSGNVQWEADTYGRLVAGSENVTLDANGVSISAEMWSSLIPSTPTESKSLKFYDDQGFIVGRIAGLYNRATGGSNRIGQLYIDAISRAYSTGAELGKARLILDATNETMTFNGSAVWHTGNLVFSTSGNRYGVVPTIDTSGIMDIGRYIDFHESDGDVADNSGVRLTSTSGNLYSSAAIMPNTTNVKDLGGASNKWLRTYTTSLYANYAEFAGTNTTSYLNYGANEEIYLRAGKTGAAVYIQDAHNGKVILANGGGPVLVGTTAEQPNGYAPGLYVAGSGSRANIHAAGVVTSEQYFQGKALGAAPAYASNFWRLYMIDKGSGDFEFRVKFMNFDGTVSFDYTIFKNY